jgi:hypothetical protein
MGAHFVLGYQKLVATSLAVYRTFLDDDGTPAT